MILREVATEEPSPSGAVEVSVIAPVFDEEGNLEPLHQALVETLDQIEGGYEIIYVDDGSRDRSFAELSQIAASDPRARVVQLRRNFGQTAAIAAGVHRAKGDVLVFIDSDLQNDPSDIPRLLELLDQGYDVVSGWRKDRQDATVTRLLPSIVANNLISRITGVPLHDYGCTLKAYRRELMAQLGLYGEMHRFLPAYMAQMGAKIAEVPVTHHPRVRGKSKYGLSRTFRVMLDLLTVKFLGTFGTKPSHIFGGLGLTSIGLSFVVGVAMLVQKWLLGVSLIQTPLLLLSALLFLMGFQSILMGFLSEMQMRTYHESQGKRTYVVRQVLNL